MFPHSKWRMCNAFIFISEETSSVIWLILQLSDQLKIYVETLCRKFGKFKNYFCLKNSVPNYIFHVFLTCNYNNANYEVPGWYWELIHTFLIFLFFSFKIIQQHRPWHRGTGTLSSQERSSGLDFLLGIWIWHPVYTCVCVLLLASLKWWLLAY